MGKLLKSVIASILIQASSSNDNFEVTSCNHETSRRPALSFRIAQDYFENNLNDPNNDYTFNNGFYERTIDEADLDFAFGDSNDQIQLSFTIPITSTGFDLDDDTRISYAENNIRFQCNYDRQISVSQSYQQVPLDQPIQGQGELSYRMIINAGALGGTTEVQILPNHGLDQVAPTFTECKVIDSTNTHAVFLMHSFENDSICFDSARLNVAQTEFSPNASFNMRTFRFNDGGSATEPQEQTVICTLHLDPVNEISREQASECSCYTQTECEERSHLRGPYLLMQSGSYDFSEGAPRYGPPFTIFDPSDGFINTNIELEHQKDQNDRGGVAGACAAMLNGESYIIGGYRTNRIRKIEGCAVRDLGLFAWDGPDGPTRWWAFPHPKCGTYNFDGTDKILLCSPAYTGETCYWCITYDGRDGSIGEQLARNGEGVRTRHCHGRGGMGSSLGRPVILEGSTVGTEILDMTTLEWSQGPTQPFYNSRRPLHGFSTIQRDVDTFYVVGGQQDGIAIHKKILKFEANVWSHVGDMQFSRRDEPQLAFNGNELLIMGGYSHERWGAPFTDDDATEVEIWDIETGIGRVDEELTQAMRIRNGMYTTLVKVVESASCSGTD